MTNPQLIAIAALADNRVIGHAGGIPWRLREEMRWFREVTLGHPVVMGHRTFRSLSKPLPGRLNVVLTRNNPQTPEKYTETPSEGPIWLSPAQPEEILAQPFARTAEKIFIIGGAQIYQAFLPLCDHLILSHVRGQWEGDTFFPPFQNDFQSAEILKENPDFTARLWIRHTRP